METHGVRPTPEEARSALADTERVRASAAALSATPWPTWFFLTITLYLAAFPIAYGGVVADSDWLLPRPAWVAVLLVIIATFSALFGVAARSWRSRTGVALRLDVLPKRVTVPFMAGLPLLLVGAAFAFRATGRPVWLIAASLIGATVSVGFHLAFLRLHRRTA
ncbi:hypothetical protein [Streptomyces sp. bgisy022]|uniref:hypothetical protein n=1 Tax=Streptomyces sp. bgisy022 TaxID=3413769 RepID=UPI003D72BB63